MSDSTILTNETAGREDSLARVCSVCARIAHGDLIAVETLPEDLQKIVASNTAAPGGNEVCGQCIEFLNRAKYQLDSHVSIFEQNDFVLPTPLRMDADERFTGSGVTIAFLDSGFYAHPDLTEPRHRILAYHSIFSAD